MSTANYTAFISYRHQSPDQEVAKALHTAIETYGIPASVRRQTGRKNMGKVFRDQEELPLSSDLGADIEAALDHSEWFIAICSPRYLKSGWCLREMEYFIAHKGREHVLTVLVEGEPEDSFPEMIRFTTNAVGQRVENEPLAANVRSATAAGRLKAVRQEKLRILAPMLGLSYDDLKRRARQRRIRITALTAAAVFAAVAGLSAYLITSHIRSEALKKAAAEQERIAEEQRVLAVSNEIGELLEKAETARQANEKRSAAGLLSDAYALSEADNGLRHEEILAGMRRTAFTEPFSTVSCFTDQNVRLLDMVPSPDGKTALGIENQNSIAMVDLETNSVLYKVSLSNESISAPRFSADGSRFLAVCDQGRTVGIWNSADGSPIYTYTSRQNQPYQIANAFFFRDADTVLVQDMDEIYRITADGTTSLFYRLGDQQSDYDYDYNLFTILTEKPIHELFQSLAEDYSGMSLLTSADESLLLAAGKDGTTGTIILDADGNRVSLLAGMPGLLSEHYTFSPDGRYAACISYFGFIAWWDAQTGEIQNLLFVDYENDFMFSDLVFSPDSRVLAFVGENHLYTYDIGANAVLLDIELEETNIVPDLCYTADGRYLLASDQNFYVIDAETGELYLRMNGEFNSAYNNVVELGNTIFVTRNDGTAYLLGSEAISTVTVRESFDGSLLPSYEELSLAAVSGSLPTLQSTHRLSEGFIHSTAHTDLAPHMHYSLDGSRAALSHADGVIELFRTDGSGEVDLMLAQLTDRIAALGMTADILVASDDLDRIMFYDLNTSSVIRILNNDGYYYTGFAFDPSGEYVMALRHDNAVIDVFRLRTAELLFSIKTTDAGGFTEFAFSEDGAYAVGKTGSGVCVGDMLTSESAVLAQIRILTELYK